MPGDVIPEAGSGFGPASACSDRHQAGPPMPLGYIRWEHEEQPEAGAGVECVRGQL